MIVVGLVMAMAMLVQQMVLVHSHESFWNDYQADWKVADFAQERHHYDDNAENTNYTWVDDEQSQNASIGNTSTADRRRRRIPRLQQQLLEQQQRARATTANGSANGTTESNGDDNPWLTVLASAGVKVTTEQEKLLPELDKNWKELFGMEPIILGMETVRTWDVTGLVW
jgi:hypothetical protein